MTASRLRRHVHVVAALATAAVLSLPPGLAADGAMFGGRVLGRDGVTPRAGVTVHLIDPAGAVTARSARTGELGAFRIDGAPAGRYHLVVEAPEGAFLSPEPLELESGANAPLALALQTAAPGAAPARSGFGPAGLPTWSKWLIVGVIGATALFVIDDVGEDEEEPASGF